MINRHLQLADNVKWYCKVSKTCNGNLSTTKGQAHTFDLVMQRQSYFRRFLKGFLNIEIFHNFCYG